MIDLERVHNLVRFIVHVFLFQNFIGYFKSGYKFEILASMGVTHSQYLELFLSSRTATCTSWECVSGWLCACVPCTYICFYISEHMCGFWGKLQALHSYRRSASLKFSQLIVFHTRRVCCRKLKCSAGRENDFTWRFSGFWMY